MVYRRSQKDRDVVEKMVSYGIPLREIADVIGINKDTVRKYYEEEIKTATAKANAKVAETLYGKATGGSIRAMTFWLEKRGGESWKPRQTIEHEQDFGGKFTIKLGGEEEMPNFIEQMNDHNNN